MSHTSPPFKIVAIKDFVPRAVKPWLMILFVLLIQISGGVYLAASSYMVGSTGLLEEDIMMAGQASLVGMALFFGLMFRLKMAVPPKTTLTFTGLGIIATNILCMYVTNVPLLVAICFIGGFLRMWATFECNSTIQLWLTPKRDMSVFFSYIYLIVNSTINLNGIIAVHTASAISWEYMHLLVTGAIAIMRLVVRMIHTNERVMPPLPLFGVDWLGMILWGCTALSILFVCIYGEHYDWFDSVNIRMACLFGFIALALNLWRASFIRHSFIYLKTLSMPILPITIGIILIADFLLAPGHIFEHILTESLLGYDSLNHISLNWWGLAGSLVGVGLSYQLFARRKWSYQRMLVLSFIGITAYLAIFYFFIDYNLPYEALILPIMIRNAGYILLAVAVLTALTRLPFPFHFCQGVCMQNMFSAALASTICTAVLGRILTVVTQRNVEILGTNIDNLNTQAHLTINTPMGNAYTALPIHELYGAVQAQALMISMKEIYGWLLLTSIACILFLLVRRSSIRPVRVIHPLFSTIRTRLFHDVKMRIKAVRRN